MTTTTPRTYAAADFANARFATKGDMIAARVDPRDRSEAWARSREGDSFGAFWTSDAGMARDGWTPAQLAPTAPSRAAVDAAIARFVAHDWVGDYDRRDEDVRSVVTDALTAAFNATDHVQALADVIREAMEAEGGDSPEQIAAALDRLGYTLTPQQ